MRLFTEICTRDLHRFRQRDIFCKDCRGSARRRRTRHTKTISGKLPGAKFIGDLPEIEVTLAPVHANSYGARLHGVSSHYVDSHYVDSHYVDSRCVNSRCVNSRKAGLEKHNSVCHCSISFRSTRDSCVAPHSPFPK